MLLKADCIPCMLKMTVEFLKKLEGPGPSTEEALTRILEIPPMRGLNWQITPPEMAEYIMREIVALTGDRDPFGPLKKEQNRRALQLYPWLKEMVEASPDPLYLALNLAVSGNSMDVAEHHDPARLRQLMEERMKKAVSRESFSRFRQKLLNSGRIVFLGDNCGEVVFDHLLIEVMMKEADLDITYVARSLPSLNDVTLKDVRGLGFDCGVTYLGNGIDGPLPGTIVARCSDRLKDLLLEADFIVSKGGGNFDTLDEERSLPTDISFLLMAKCAPYCNALGARKNEPILENRFERGPS
ncbi:MAG: DUF89 family protein [Deltaproteobacteria bacterium]|nr:DUF89 family protein [Deltaproteobacteria bacterium]